MYCSRAFLLSSTNERSPWLVHSLDFFPGNLGNDDRKWWPFINDSTWAWPVKRHEWVGSVDSRGGGSVLGGGGKWEGKRKGRLKTSEVLVVFSPGGVEHLQRRRFRTIPVLGMKKIVQCAVTKQLSLSSAIEQPFKAHLLHRKQPVLR